MNTQQLHGWLVDHMPHLVSELEWVCKQVARSIAAECYPLSSQTEGSVIFVAFAVGTNYGGRRCWMQEVIDPTAVGSIFDALPVAAIKTRRIEIEAVHYVVPIEHPIQIGFFNRVSDILIDAFITHQNNQGR